MTERDAEAGQAKREEGRAYGCASGEGEKGTMLELCHQPAPLYCVAGGSGFKSLSSCAHLGDIQPHPCAVSLPGTQVSCRRRQSNPPTCIVSFIPLHMVSLEREDEED